MEPDGTRMLHSKQMENRAQQWYGRVQRMEEHKRLNEYCNGNAQEENGSVDRP